MNYLYRLFAITLFVLLLAQNTVVSAETPISETTKQIEIQTVKTYPIISKKLEKDIKSSIAKIYGQDKVNEIYSKIYKIATEAKQERSEDLKTEDKTRTSDWYKDEIVYMFYVDQFGTISDKKRNTFKDSIKMLDYLKDLGVTTIYMLPFADSPMQDAGFDVRNPQDVRERLGGVEGFKEFATEARKYGFKLKADLP